MKHREVIIAMANDEKVEFRSGEHCPWTDASKSNPISHPQYEWRITPKMLSINGMEFPAPVGGSTGEFYIVVKRGELNKVAAVMNSFYHHTEADACQMYDAIVKACTP
jgi:hypothetical protein